jgi:hypothetical protein
LYDNFENWFKLKFPDDKIPSDKEFIKNLRYHKKVEKDVRIGDMVRKELNKLN